MTFVQYYDYGLDGKLAEVIGDRGVVILDGRNSISNMIKDAKKENGHRRPKYPAFVICKGENLLRFTHITPIMTFKQ